MSPAAMTASEADLGANKLHACLQMAALKGQLGELCLPHVTCAGGEAGHRGRIEG